MPWRGGVTAAADDVSGGVDAGLVAYLQALAELFQQLITVAPEDFDDALVAAQERLCLAADADMSAVFRPVRSGRRVVELTHAFQRGEGRPLPNPLNASRLFPWSQRHIAQGEAVVIDDIADLPADAAVDQRSWRSFGIRSGLMYPLVGRGGRVVGGLALGRSGRPRPFEPVWVERLRGAAQVFATVLQRHDVQVALQESESRFRHLADNSTVGVYFVQDDRIAYANRALADMLGYGVDEFIGVDPMALVDPADAGGFRDSILAGLAEPEATSQHRVRGVHRDGSRRQLEIYSVRTVLDGRPAIVGNVVDVTEAHEAQARLAASERRYRLLVDNMSDVVMLVDAQRRFHWVSPSAATMLGWTSSQMDGQFYDEYVHPDDLHVIERSLAEAAAPERLAAMRFRFRCADGSYRWVATSGREAFDEQGRPLGRVVAVRDIHDQVVAEQELAAREQRFRLLAENASDVVWEMTADDVVVWVSPSVTAVLGWHPSELVGRSALDLAHPDDAAGLIRARKRVDEGRVISGETRFRCADGGWRWVEVTGRLLPTREDGSRVVGMRDIEDIVGTRTQLQHVIAHDALTGLPNRSAVLARLAELLARPAGPGLLAVLGVGVDDLSTVNAALGHAAGDLVLATLAARIGQVAGEGAVVGRGTGAEFLVVLPGLPDAAAAAAVAERIRGAAGDPIAVASRELRETVSIGVATGDPGADADGLVRDAMLAMKRAKHVGRDRVIFFDPGLAAEVEHQLGVLAQVRDGLRQGQLAAWYQPIVDFGLGRTAGYEALVRWVRDGQVVPPDRFLPAVESTTVIADLDLVVLGQAVGALTRLPEPVFVSVNVSPNTLRLVDYAGHIAAALRDSRVDARRLHVEVTETTLLSVTDTVHDAIGSIAETGARWYVDDFGTGYSSIAHLRDLPVSGLKLDVSFTRGIERGDDTSIRLAQALAGMAQGLGLDTVAEGVETEHQAMVLAAQGWRHGQGWHYGKAAPLDADTVRGNS